MEAIFLCFKGTHLSLESFTRFFSKNRRFQRRLWPQPAGCERTLASASSGGGGETVRSFPPGWLNIHLTGRNRQMEIHAVWLFKTAKHRDAASASGRCGPAELQWNADELFHIEVHAVWPFKTAKHRDAASVSGHCGPAELQWNADELFHLRFTPFGRSKRPNTGTLRVSRSGRCGPAEHSFDGTQPSNGGSRRLAVQNGQTPGTSSEGFPVPGRCECLGPLRAG